MGSSSVSRRFAAAGRTGVLVAIAAAVAGLAASAVPAEKPAPADPPAHVRPSLADAEGLLGAGTWRAGRGDWDEPLPPLTGLPPLPDDVPVLAVRVTDAGTVAELIGPVAPESLHQFWSERGWQLAGDENPRFLASADNRVLVWIFPPARGRGGHHVLIVAANQGADR